MQNETAILGDFNMPVEVEAQEDDLRLIKRLCEINPFLKIPASNPDVYDNHHMLIENYQKNLLRPFCDKVESRGIIFILLSHFLRYAQPKASVKDDRILQAIAFIRANINNRIDIDQLADKACMSKGHFFRMFKEETGDTPTNYIIRRKMEKAELLLVTTDNPVKTIADSLGYEDYSYFNRIFKKSTGVTPQQYREKH